MPSNPLFPAGLRVGEPETIDTICGDVSECLVTGPDLTEVATVRGATPAEARARAEAIVRQVERGDEVECASCGGVAWSQADHCTGCGKVVCMVCVTVFGHWSKGRHAVGDPAEAVAALGEVLSDGMRADGKTWREVCADYEEQLREAGEELADARALIAGAALDTRALLARLRGQAESGGGGE